MEPFSPPSQSLESAASKALCQAVQQAATEVFGISALRPQQSEVLQHVLAGRDCLAVLPTGSGKSLCYGLPAHLRPGLVLVLSPLIALIRDQARRFQTNGIACAAMDSLQTDEERAAVWARLGRREVRLLLLSPERLARRDFRARLRAHPLQLVAIDEAHCISHWGSHFRPEYRQLGGYLEDFGPTPKLALTATATARVRADIAQVLRLRDPAVVLVDFHRDNLHLKAVRADTIEAQFAATLQAVSASTGNGIVYASTRRQAREIYRMLVAAGVRVALYHAGLAPPLREAAQAAFMAGEVRVVVATHAFGMGIDKADIRFVHHASLPASLEQYVQEIGRAGRDGKPARCTLVYGTGDYHVQKFMIERSFPELGILQRILTAAGEFLGNGSGETPAALNHHLVSLGVASSQALTEATELLCREGLLTRLVPHHGPAGEALITLGQRAEEANLFRDYPLRKRDRLAKLEAMLAFASAGEGRKQLLADYFRA